MTEGINLLRPDETGQIKKILFERPISRLNSRTIGILAGKHAALKTINDIHQIISVLNHNLVIVAETELAEHSVPAQLFLRADSKRATMYENTDEGINIFSDCSFVVVGLDIEICSRLQIFLEKLIASRSAPIIFTSESVGLFKISPHLAQKRKGDVFICNTKSLTTLANYLSLGVNFKSGAGVFNKLNLMTELSNYLSANIACVEDYQILAVSYTDKNKAAIINLNNEKSKKLDSYYISVLASLLCDTPNPQKDMLDRLLTSGYLIRSGVKKSQNIASGIKTALAE